MLTTVALVLALPLTAPTVLRAVDYGLVADGQTDDGPAIARLLAAAEPAGPVRLVFPDRATIRVETAPERYVFRFQDRTDITLDGGGSTFLLGPRVRFLRLTACRRVTIRRLQVDCSPLPFAEGAVTGVDAAARRLTVRLAPGFARPEGGPTRADGEQAFFAMLWNDGPYALASRHCWVTDQRPGDRPDEVQVSCAESFKTYGEVVPGQTRITLPTPGIAHRYGPGACFEIADNEDVSLEDVDLWSAPWFGFRVFRNAGEVVFRRVNIRPKPGAGRLTSVWRDGFHVKGNRGRLLWEECWLEGMNDDALNLSTHTSRVRRLLSPTRVEVLQTFPLGPMPWHPGAHLQVADLATRTLVGRAQITAVEDWRIVPRADGEPAVAPCVLVLDQPLAGLTAGQMVWEPEAANPDTTLRRCVIRQSCRLQSPATFIACDVAALLWFYAEGIEGPFPSGVTLRDCDLRRGRGNPRLAVSFAGRTATSDRPSAIHDVVLEGNRIRGDLSLIGVDRVNLSGNRGLEPGAKVTLERCRALTATDNLTAAGQPWPTGD